MSSRIPLLPQVFLNLTDEVTITTNNSGLVGMVLHPDWPAKPFYFLCYTTDDQTVALSRFTAVSHQNGNISSEYALMRVPFPSFNNIGGNLAFGPDRYLYIGCTTDLSTNPSRFPIFPLLLFFWLPGMNPNSRWWATGRKPDQCLSKPNSVFWKDAAHWCQQ